MQGVENRTERKLIPRIKWNQNWSFVARTRLIVLDKERTYSPEIDATGIIESTEQHVSSSMSKYADSRQQCSSTRKEEQVRSIRHEPYSQQQHKLQSRQTVRNQANRPPEANEDIKYMAWQENARGYMRAAVLCVR